MRSSVCPALTTAAIVHGLSTDHDRRRGQRCTVLTHPVSLIHRGISVQINRATSKALLPSNIQSLCEAALIKRNERVFLAGTIPFWMYYVFSGEVTLERSGLHGESVVLQRTRQGFVSEASLKVSRYHCDAIAIEDTHVIKVPVKALARALDADAAFAGRWINMLNTEIRRLRLHLERLSMKSIRERLIHMIETEGKAGQFATPSGIKTLAGELGITHEALYRTISKLESDKVLRRDGNYLTLIRSPEPSF